MSASSANDHRNADPPPPNRLSGLQPDQPIVYAGDRVSVVSAELAAAFRPGDRVVVDPSSGELLHIPVAVHDLVAASVDAASAAFGELARCADDRIDLFFTSFADRLADAATIAPIMAANVADVERAAARGRSTTRLVLSDSMRADMIAGLRSWAASPLRRDQLVGTVDHEGWAVDARRAPLGVVGFVFEGRPNVFADAVGVVRTGNTVVFRIGSDALRTAEAIVEHVLAPALAEAGLPSGTVNLVASPVHAAGWALFSDTRVALAVARGSGAAVAQLGAVARQAGVPVSLHGTGGAWLVAAADADAVRFSAAVTHSLDRKVCNTLNVCCIVADRAADLVPVFVTAVDDAATARGVGARIHATVEAMRWIDSATLQRHSSVGRADGVHDEPLVTELGVEQLGREWEWEASPEISLHITESVDDAVALCNRLSPRFVAALVSESSDTHDEFFATVDAPFVGDGFTRWVDGQYALDTPELGLSNWEGGRMLARGGILSGDSVHTVRYRARISDPNLHR